MKKLYSATAGLVGCLPAFFEVYETPKEAVHGLGLAHDIGYTSKLMLALAENFYVDLDLEKHGNEYLQIQELNLMDWIGDNGPEEVLSDPDTPQWIKDYLLEDAGKRVAKYNGIEVRNTLNGYVAYYQGKCLHLGDGVDMFLLNGWAVPSGTEAFWDLLKMTLEKQFKETVEAIYAQGL